MCMVHIKETIFTYELKLSLLPKWRKTCIVIFRFYNKDFLFYGAGKKFSNKPLGNIKKCIIQEYALPFSLLSKHISSYGYP